MSLKKIAITGPESTGKSVLSEELAGFFRTEYVPEYAREYLMQLNKPYKKDDLLLIAKGQIALEKKLESLTDDWLFCDTDLLVIKIWSIHKYNQCDPWILEMILKNCYDLFLICDIDMPWKFDPLRENPDDRKYFMDWFIRELEDYDFPYHIVKGQGQQRTENAIQLLQTYFQDIM